MTEKTLQSFGLEKNSRWDTQYSESGLYFTQKALKDLDFGGMFNRLFFENKLAKKVTQFTSYIELQNNNCNYIISTEKSEKSSILHDGFPSRFMKLIFGWPRSPTGLCILSQMLAGGLVVS